MYCKVNSIVGLFALAQLTSCHIPHSGAPASSMTVRHDVPALLAEPAPEVVRYDRYLLVRSDPVTAQRDPLSAMIDIHIPASTHPSVGDALRYVLRLSGYSLCVTGLANKVLYRQRLPGTQYRLGPMRLRSALQVMSGPAWLVVVDDVARVVCHRLRERYPRPVSLPARLFVYSGNGD